MNDYLDIARQQAAQAWCKETTSGKEMDVTLAEEFAQILANWIEIAAQNQRNTDFYRDLLDETAQYLGNEVFISDDGSIQDEPIRLKIPELVKELTVS